MYKRIHAHGVETYPHECCGALLGRDGDASREVEDLLPLANRRDDSPRNRFEVTPDDVRLAEKTAREKRLDLIGWYHSHPDAPARPRVALVQLHHRKRAEGRAAGHDVLAPAGRSRRLRSGVDRDQSALTEHL